MPAPVRPSAAPPRGLTVLSGLEAFWSLPLPRLLAALQTDGEGLSDEEAARRLLRQAPALRAQNAWLAGLRLFAGQFKSPITLILLFAAGLSAALHDGTDALVILTIVGIGALLGFWQEWSASGAVSALLALVRAEARVRRDGRELSVPFDQVVPGDVLLLAAGAGIPADCRLLEAKELHVNEAALTGETFPVEKRPGEQGADTPLARREGSLAMGTYVVSGSAKALVVRTGADTEFGHLSARLRRAPAPTEFERGVTQFGGLLMQVMLLLVVGIFAINVYAHRPVFDSLLFSLALAVGLTPQLLPAVITINLAHGARRMAAARVIVKHLPAIENFGAMDVLCSDKTGTLTEGRIRLDGACGLDGGDSPRVRSLALLNAAFETGLDNPIDAAIRAGVSADLSAYRKLDEVPYDFNRKRLSVLVGRAGEALMVTKGALENVLEVCTRAERADGALEAIAPHREAIRARFEAYSRQGYRVLGVAFRESLDDVITRESEAEMVFAGFLLFLDPPKAGIEATITRLAELGVGLKVITGDNRFAAAHLAEAVGLDPAAMIVGAELAKMSQEALVARVGATALFAEVEPNQKERILLALRAAGHVVGYMGDGINDGPALHAADVGISVDSAVDVAKEAAAIVLLEQDLGVLVEGVRQGRTTFANTLKYVFMATSANFGNMFSMAGASLFLPFLPLLPGQILLTNLLTDFPEMAIAVDRVDPEAVEAPQRWDIAFIRRFMLVFGLASSVFDYLTFGVLFWLMHADPARFRAGWFVESVASAALIVLAIRTRRPFWRSRPSLALGGATLAVVAVACLLPASPLASALGFEPLPLAFYAVIGAILASYVGLIELAKRVFYRGSAPARAERPGGAFGPRGGLQAPLPHP